MCSPSLNRPQSPLHGWGLLWVPLPVWSIGKGHLTKSSLGAQTADHVRQAGGPSRTPHWGPSSEHCLFFAQCNMKTVKPTIKMWMCSRPTAVYPPLVFVVVCLFDDWFSHILFSNQFITHFPGNESHAYWTQPKKPMKLQCSIPVCSFPQISPKSLTFNYLPLGSTCAWNLSRSTYT